MSREKKSVAFYQGSSWFHRTKVLQENGEIKYGRRGGFATASEAEESYRKCEEEFQKAYRSYQMTHKLNMDISFKDYLIHWFEEIYSARIENTTRMVGAYTLYNLLLPHMEQDIKLRYVNVEYLNRLLERAAKATESAGNKCREMLNLSLKEAVTQGFLKNNPVPGTKPYRRKTPTVAVLSKEKMKVFLAAASKNGWYLEILLALFCGLRKGENQGLKMEDFCIESHSVHIKRQITSNPIVPKGDCKIADYQIIEKQPKTVNSDRILNVPDVIWKELERRKTQIMIYKDAKGESFCDKGYISCRENGLPHSVTALNNALTKICEKNGLPHVTVHGLRHMYASILLAQGTPLIKISACLGHASVNTTYEYYCEVADDDEIIGFMNSTFIPGEDEE